LRYRGPRNNLISGVGGATAQHEKTAKGEAWKWKGTSTGHGKGTKGNPRDRTTDQTVRKREADRDDTREGRRRWAEQPVYA